MQKLTYKVIKMPRHRFTYISYTYKRTFQYLDDSYLVRAVRGHLLLIFGQRFQNLHCCFYCVLCSFSCLAFWLKLGAKAKQRNKKQNVGETTSHFFRFYNNNGKIKCSTSAIYLIAKNLFVHVGQVITVSQKLNVLASV